MFFRRRESQLNRKRLQSYRLWLNTLEDRLVPAALIVTDSGDTGTNTLRGRLAVADTNGEDDTITFQAGITAINLTTGQISLTGQNNKLTIDGGGAVTINGGAASATNRIFNFNVAAGNPTITLQNLTLANGNLTGSNNGGAILLNNDPLVLSDVTFSGNKTAGGGGAIATTSAVAANISITNGAFTNNSAGTVAGAIFGLSSLTLNVNGTSFTGNSAATTAGAIQANGTSSVTITGATFANNVSVASSTGGGAILSGGIASNWSLTNTSFTSNLSLGGPTGAVGVSGASTTFNMTGCTFTGNSAGNGTGGAMRFSASPVTITMDSTRITGNTANSAGASGTGAGLSVYSFGGGSLSITNSTISGNSATAAGGGLYLRTTTLPFTATLTNSTVSDNVIGNGVGDGGGVFVTLANLTINNCTITGNTAGATSGSGGGIRKTQVSGFGSLTLNSTILAGNAAGSSNVGDFSSNATIPFTVKGGHNVVGVADVPGVTFAGVNKTGTFASPLDPLLNPLGNYGGPTPTHSLKAGSPAFNFGNNLLGLTLDQRGAGNPRVNGGVPDVGAFEGANNDPAATATLVNVPPTNATYEAKVVFVDATGIDTTTIDTNDVLLSGPGYASPASPTGVAVSGSGTSVTATYTFTPPGGSWDWTDNGSYTLSIVAGEVEDTDGSPNAVPAGPLEVFSVTVPLPSPLVVDKLGDGDDGNFGKGELTLREAIRLANITAGQLDSITFDAALSGQTITVGSMISITDAVSITGLGASNLTLSGGTLSRLFNINLPNSTDTVTFNQLRIADGNATTGQGGAITVDGGNLTLSTVTLTNNQATTATGAAGGAILFNTAGKLTFNNCTITNNAAAGSATAAVAGGGVVFAANAATITFDKCLVDNNSGGVNVAGVVRGQTSLTLNITDSTITNNGGAAGGVVFTGANMAVSVVRSTVSGNFATALAAAGAGGAFYFQGTGAFAAESSTFSSNFANVGGVISIRTNSATFTQCTFDGNIAAGTGGGVANLNSSGGSIVLNNCTVSGNSAFGNGGGIRKAVNGASITLNSTLIAGNTATGGGGPDIDCNTGTATTIAGGNNLVGVSDKGNFILSGTNKTGTNASPLDPLLNPLADNGGPTLTRSLQPGSPAFDFGANPLTLQYDQRGGDGAGPLTDYARTLQNGIDIGAFEGFNPVPAYSGTLANVPPINATYKASVTYTSPVGINTGSIGVGDVRFAGPGYASPEAPISATVTAGSNGDKSVTVEYVFNPPGGSWDYTDDGVYTLSVQANEVYDTNVSPLAAVAGQVNTMLVAIPLPVLVVDSTDDIDDSDYSAGNFTLREAINRANAAVSTTETITFAPSLNSSTITLYSLLNITDPVIINGLGAAKLTITGGGITSLFSTSIPTAGSQVMMSGLTLTGAIGSVGAAMLISSESVTISDCHISGNTTTQGNAFAGGALTITGAAGTLNVYNCTFDSNSSGGGSAICAQNGATLLVNNSLFTNNVMGGGNSGGAIRYVGTPTATNCVIRNSTFTNNRSRYNGGAIGFQFNSKNVYVQNCTIVGNVADYDDTNGGDGGGIAALATFPVVIESSIVAGNFRGTTAPVADDINNVSNSIVANYSLIGTSAGTTNFMPDAKTTALLGQNPMLGSLAANGGPTQTMAPLPGSPALDNGSNPFGLAYDQRGPGYARQSGKAVDIGALEVQVAPTATVTIDSGTGQRSMIQSLTITFSEPVVFTGSAAAAITLQRLGTSASPGPTGAVALSFNPPSGPASVFTVTFNDPSFAPLVGSAKSLIDGQYQLVLSASQIKAAASGMAFDGDGNGTGGDNQATNFHRLYGDVRGASTADFSGNGFTDNVDLIAFRNANGSDSTQVNYDPALDVNGDGFIDNIDLIAFRQRLGVTP